MKHSFTIPGSKKLPIHGDVHIPDGEGPFPVIVFAHGFKGFKDWGAFPYLFSKFAELGIYTVSFNFSHNGIGENPLEFTRLEDFKENNLSLEVDDLECVLKALLMQSLPESQRADLKKITLVGHSRGGSSVLRCAARDSSVASVITLASISKIPPVSPQTAASWREAGVHFVENMRTGQQMPMGLGMLEDLLNTKTAIEDACKKIQVPVLAIHGKEDNVVPASSAQDIADWCCKGETLLIENADHVFGVKHPYSGTNDIFEHVIKTIVSRVTSL